VFAQNRLPHAVNGSLWSLPVEFFMYALLALLGFVSSYLSSSKLSSWLLGITTAGFMGLLSLWAWSATEPLVVYRADLRQIPLCGVYFMVGACLLKFKAEKYFSLSNVVLLVVAWLCLSRQPLWFVAASWLVLPFVVLAFGLSHHSMLARFGQFDYSYGIYIYAFPVQQTIVSFWPQMPFIEYLFSTFAATVTLAALSWHFVEKPSLKLKPFRG
jgi:peptidoglycan/LPS O-acetylase OafA/YrhL